MITLGKTRQHFIGRKRKVIQVLDLRPWRIGYWTSVVFPDQAVDLSRIFPGCKLLQDGLTFTNAKEIDIPICIKKIRTHGRDMDSAKNGFDFGSGHFDHPGKIVSVQKSGGGSRKTHQVRMKVKDYLGSGFLAVRGPGSQTVVDKEIVS